METNVAAFSDSSNPGILMPELPSEITDFIASARLSVDQLAARQKMLEQRIALSERNTDTELSKIYRLVDDFQKTLSSADVQSWRSTNEALYKESKHQVTNMQEALDEIKKSLKASCAHLDTTSAQIIKGVSKTLSGLHPTSLEQFAEDSAQQIKSITECAIKEINVVRKWYHWKNLAMVFMITLLAAIFTGMFIDDEWPWESHKTVAKERVAGQALLSTWQQLSLADQQHILSSATTSTG